MAGATVGLVVVGLLGFWFDHQRQERARRVLRHQAVSPAWLARRSLEADAREIRSNGAAHLVSSWRDNKDRIDRIEKQTAEVLRLSAEVGGDFRTKGRNVFATWIGYADVMNSREQGTTAYSDDDLADHLFAAIDALEEVQPRDANEPAIPTLPETKSALQIRNSREYDPIKGTYS